MSLGVVESVSAMEAAVEAEQKKRSFSWVARGKCCLLQSLSLSMANWQWQWR